MRQSRSEPFASGRLASMAGVILCASELPSVTFQDTENTDVQGVNPISAPTWNEDKFDATLRWGCPDEIGAMRRIGVQEAHQAAERRDSVSQERTITTHRTAGSPR
jgi:hypothetical protein